MLKLWTDLQRSDGKNNVADADVLGADPINTRPQFAEMLQMLMTNGTRIIVVETASRFSRDLITQ